MTSRSKYSKLPIQAPISVLMASMMVLSLGLSACAGQEPTRSYEDTAMPYAGDRAAQEEVAESAPTGARDRYAAADVDTGDRPDDAVTRPDSDPPPEAETPDRKTPLLIYTGKLVLAIFNVDQTQEKAVELVEGMGGYVSHRSSNRLTARVPAERFRDAMDDLSDLGDVLDTSWQAQDVTEEVRDLDIRLRNAMELRNRLEALLDRAETIEEALEIESELERITLEIERIRGQLRSFEDRIAYSTIRIEFRAKRMDEVPDEDFMLPFDWLDNLGLESLLRTPEVYR